MIRSYEFNHWDGKLPKASCLCPTYGRPHLLGEAIECFLRQDYPGEKELIVLNDHPQMPVVVPDLPGVKVINCETRFNSLGEKRNALAALASGDVFFPWDDDDISLPWRLSVTLARMTNHHYFKPADYWWWTGTRTEHHRNVMAHAMAAYSAELFNRIGGYAKTNSGEDQEIEARIGATGLHHFEELGPRDTFYIYRLNYVHTYHISAHRMGEGWEECEMEVAKQTDPGRKEVVPEWRMPYDAIAAKAFPLEHQDLVPQALPKILVGICSCHRHVEKRAAIRETWLANPPPNVTARFFVGQGSPDTEEVDTARLDSADNYDHLPAKVLAFFRYALANFEFDYLFKCDDDTFVSLDRLAELALDHPDLVGNYRLRDDGFASGGAGYLLSRKWVEFLANDPTIQSHGCEDVIITQAAMRAGAVPTVSDRLCATMGSIPRPNNSVITCHWCSPDDMRLIQSNLNPASAEEIDVTHSHWRDKITLHPDGLFSRASIADGGSWVRDGQVLKLRWFKWSEEVAVPSEHSGSSTATTLARYSCLKMPVRTITVELSGGMGNQMFQYAHGLALSRLFGADLKLTYVGKYRRFALDVFGIQLDDLLPEPFHRILDEESYKAGTPWPTYRAVLNGISAPDLRVSGYFQNEGYFLPVVDDIRKTFRLPSLARGENGPFKVGVHVRRGDFVGCRRHDLCNPDYFRAAMTVMRGFVPGAAFHVVSDDPGWCAKALAGHDDLFIEPAHDERTALTSLASCDGFILSNSTFGWWAAWLADSGPVVAPNRFISDGDWNICRPSWIQLPPDGKMC